MRDDTGYMNPLDDLKAFAMIAQLRRWGACDDWFVGADKETGLPSSKKPNVFGTLFQPLCVPGENPHPAGANDRCDYWGLAKVRRAPAASSPPPPSCPFLPCPL